MTERTWTPRSQRVREMLEEEDTKHLPSPRFAPGQRPLKPAASAELTPAESEAKPPSSPAKTRPPVNIDLDVVRAELALLAETEPEALIKGMMLECRELVRGTAGVICNPDHSSLHDDYFHTLKGAAELTARLAEAIAKLRPGGAVEERCQRIVVERIERNLPALRGEGGAGLRKNE